MKYSIPFWEDYYKADSLEKRRMVEKMPVLKELIESIKEDKHGEKTFYMIINSLFEDLANHMEEKLK